MNFSALMVSQVKNTVTGYFYSNEKYKYTCPELRVTLQMDTGEENQDSILRNTSAVKKFWQPHEDDFIVSGSENKKPITVSGDTAATVAGPALSVAAEKKLLESFEKRSNIIARTEVEGDSVR
jgi:hypothetical protein